MGSCYSFETKEVIKHDKDYYLKQERCSRMKFGKKAEKGEKNEIPYKVSQVKL